LIPPAEPGGRPRKTNMQAAMNAIVYLLRTGCPWRYLPRDGFPPRHRQTFGVEAHRVVVHSAAIQDRDGAALVLDKIRRRFRWLEMIWADSAYKAAQVDAAVAKQPDLASRSSSAATT
jgi:Putative transposase of IS4/5 family (DUF4096)